VIPKQNSYKKILVTRGEELMYRMFSTLAVFTALIILSSCAGNPLPAPVEVTVTNPFTSIQVGTAAVTLTATVAHDKKNAGVAWTLTIAGVGCSPTCGTLTFAGAPSLTAVYTPPTTTPSNQTATITAVSLANRAAIFAFNFTIQASVSVSITNKFTQQLVGSSGVVVNAAVSNDNSNSGVTWTLTAGGAPCSPACGTLTPSVAPSSAALYVAPTTLPSGSAAMPTITATSVSDTTKSDSFSFSIVAATAALQGNFTFLVRGYDGSGIPMALAGSLSADGNGNITAAEMDINDGGGITLVPSPQTGTYTIDPSFNNAARGTITITSFTFPNSSDHPSFKIALSADGKRGKIIELDGTGFLNAGTITAQDSTAAANAIPAASYAFGFDSDSPVGGRIVEAGQLILGSGGVTGGIVDESKAANANPIYSGATISPDVATSPDSLGRGTFTLTVNGNSTNYAYYIVNSNQLNVIEVDQGLMFGTVQAGVARKQISLTADSVNTSPASVLQMTGMDAVPGTANGIGPDVIIGVMTISTANGFSMTFDSNDLGNVLIEHPTAGVVTSFDSTTGRGVLSNDGGFNAGFVNSAAFYLYDVGSAFIIDIDPSTPDGTPPDQAVTNNAFSGTFVTQSGIPFNAQSLSGNLLALSGASAIPDIPNIAAVVNVNNQAGTLSGSGDLTSLNSQEGNVPNVTFNGAYTITDANLGHGSGTLPAGFFGFFQSNAQIPVSFYMIAPDQFVLIGAENGANSGVSFFDPQ
jgi:hypothetical protein